jgi:hypothetical protein
MAQAASKALLPMVRATDAIRHSDTLITADAGYHSEDNVRELHEANIPALIADGLMRKRDEKFKDQGKYKSLPDPISDKTKTAEQRRQRKPDIATNPKILSTMRTTTPVFVQQAKRSTAMAADV